MKTLKTSKLNFKKAYGMFLSLFLTFFISCGGQDFSDDKPPAVDPGPEKVSAETALFEQSGPAFIYPGIFLQKSPVTKSSPTMEEYFERAAEITSEDASAQTMVGRYKCSCERRLWVGPPKPLSSVEVTFNTITNLAAKYNLLTRTCRELTTAYSGNIYGDIESCKKI